MKYVRTKSGVYKIIHTCLNGDYLINKEIYDGLPEGVVKKDIIKEADTIKELCDCWVYINKCIPNSTPKIYYDWDKLFFENQYQEELGIDRDECEVYGAIWTDKGLIYAARKIQEYGAGAWVLI